MIKNKTSYKTEANFNIKERRQTQYEGKISEYDFIRQSWGYKTEMYIHLILFLTIVPK